MKSTIHFGHFEVVFTDDGRPCELGRGAMGITYKATDTMLQRTVALKVINPDNLTGEAARQRFLCEARAAAQLKHPNVASVFFLGAEEGTHFYAMEFVEGETLGSLIERHGPLACGMALRITAQVAEALSAAHASHLVHRDIKPANLMVIADSESQPVIKVIDFGLAKSAGTQDATLTAGGFLGTPHYASPEQLEEKDVDIRSDIYSLGATFWEMLTGRTLYTGSLARVMIGHVSEIPPIDRINAPAEIIAILHRMLAKTPDDRYQTPAELLADLRAAERVVDPNFLCDASFLQEQNANGFTLRDLLRIRGSLPLTEVLTILRPVVEALDRVGQARAASVDLRVQSIWLDFPKPATGSLGASMRKPMEEWPDFSLRFSHFHDTGSVDGTQDDEKTVLDIPAAHSGEDFVHNVAALVYELLSGKAEENGSQGYIPLSALSEVGNHVLARGLGKSTQPSYPSGNDFCADLEKSAPETTPRAQPPPPPIPGHIPGPEIPNPQVPSAPPKRRGKRPMARGIFLILLLVAGGVAFQTLRHPARKWHRNQGTPASASPTPALVTATPSVPHATPVEKPVVTTTPAPELDPDQKLKLVLGDIAEAEAMGNVKRALTEAVKVTKDFPKYDKGPAFIDEILSRSKTAAAIQRDWPLYSSAVEDAAAAGSARAMLLAADHIATTQPEKAFNLYHTAADHGLAQGMTQVGMMYLRGQGVAKDPDQAERWFREASDHKDPSGTYALGMCYLTGKGIKQDQAKAVALLEDAGNHRSGDAKNQLGKLYQNGQAGLPANRGNAFELFRQAKDLGCPEAFYNLGMLELTGPMRAKTGPARAQFLFKEGADLGSALCLYYYAKCLDEGIGGAATPMESRAWYAKAITPLKTEADAGSTAAMVYYATCLESGKGTYRNLPEATRYYVAAATAGDAAAQQWCTEHHVGPKPPTTPPATIPPRPGQPIRDRVVERLRNP